MLRRLTRAAVEDIGMADPNALLQCLAAKEMYDFLGSPEGEIGIVQACLYLATAPKSNATYIAQKKAWRSARETGSLMPPMHILNAPTKLMKDVGYGKGYAYDHDADEGFSGQDYWPEEMDAAGPSTSRPTAASKRRCASGWNIGTSGAKSCNKAATTRVKRPEPKQGAARMYQVDRSAYWQAQMMHWGPKVLIAHPHPGRDLDRRAGGQMGAPEGDRPHRPALRKHVTGTPEETVGHQLGAIAKLIIWLVGIMAALQLPRHRPDPRADQRAGDRDFRLPAAADRRRPDLLRRPDRRADRPAAGRDGADRRQRRRPARPDRHRRDRRHACAPTRRRFRRAPRRAQRAPASPGGRRPRLRADHHPGRDRRAAGPRDRSDLRPGDRDAQPDPRRDPARPRRGAVDRHRVHRRALPEDDHRGDPAADRLRRGDPLDRRAPAERPPVADRRQCRDDRDHPRRVDRGGAGSSAATRSRSSSPRSPSSAAR